MSALYPDIYIRPKGTALTAGSFAGNTVNVLDGWDRLENMLEGAKWSISQAVTKKMSKGQIYTMTEKVQLEAKIVFITQALFERYRAWLNTEVDVMFHDANDPTGFIACFWGVNLAVPAGIEGGDAYTITLTADHEKRLGAGYLLANVDKMNVVSGIVTDAATGLPIEGATLVIMAHGDNLTAIAATTDADGRYLIWIDAATYDSWDLLCAADGYVLDDSADEVTVDGSREVIQNFALVEEET